ncbi:hypothetical protein OF83DRAFT_1135101 [Amylostereum chailletii]|nr:hypothetical protein OF83DRAFT_1135101 [Amylostereum chailletii]
MSVTSSVVQDARPTTAACSCKCICKCPIAEVPIELLMEMFAYLPHLEPPVDSKKYSPPTWLNVTAVCQRWRSAAFACKELWTVLPLHHPTLSHFCLEHSRPHPIILNADIPAAPIWSNVYTAVTELDRVREITIEDVIPNKFDTLKMRLLATAPAPRLEILNLKYQLAEHPCTIPKDIFAGTPPANLRELRLDSCTMQHHSPLLLTSLVVLQLQSCVGVWESADEMVATLSRMPQLETLSIEGRVTFPHDVVLAPPDAQEPIKLDSLKDLSLYGEALQITGFLQRVAFPTQTALSIEYLEPNAHAVVIAPFTRHFAPARAAHEHFKTFRLETSCSVLELTLSDPQRADGNKTGVPALLPKSIKFAITWFESDEEGHPVVHDMLRALLVALPVHGKESTLIAQRTCEGDMLNWMVPFAQLAGIRAVQVARFTAYDLLQHFLAAEHAPADAPRSFADMRYLTVRELMTRSTIRLERNTEPNVSEVAGVLLAREMKRRRAEGRECHLSLEVCSLRPEMVTFLLKAVGSDNFYCDEL